MIRDRRIATGGLSREVGRQAGKQVELLRLYAQTSWCRGRDRGRSRGRGNMQRESHDVAGQKVNSVGHPSLREEERLN